MRTFFLIAFALALAGPPAQAAEAAPAPGASSAARPAPPPLKENITLRVTTAVAPGIPFTLALTGIGPQFRSNTLINIPGDDGVARWIPVEFQATVGEAADGYEVKITINLLMAEGNPPSGRAGAMVGKVISATASATLKLGESQAVKASNGQTMTVSLAKPPAK